MAESTVQTAIVRWLRSEGFWATVIHGEAMQERGVPDILACVEGWFVAIETKRLVGQPTKLQDYHIKSITEAKGQAFVATSLDEAQRRIDQLLIRISNGEA